MGIGKMIREWVSGCEYGYGGVVHGWHEERR